VVWNNQLQRNQVDRHQVCSEYPAISSLLSIDRLRHQSATATSRGTRAVDACCHSSDVMNPVSFTQTNVRLIIPANVPTNPEDWWRSTQQILRYSGGNASAGEPQCGVIGVPVLHPVKLKSIVWKRQMFSRNSYSPMWSQYRIPLCGSWSGSVLPSFEIATETIKLWTKC